MAEKEITDRSTPAEVAEAANQLRAAQQDLQRWLDQRRNDPNTPREIFNGVDYGPMISYADIVAQSKLIANRYDYVDYGQITSPSYSRSATTVGGDQFFVRGFGSNSNAVSSGKAPLTSLSPTDDAAARQNETIVSGPGAVASGAAPSLRYPASNIGSKIAPAGSNDPRIKSEGAGRDSLANRDGIVTPDDGTGPGTGNNGTPSGNDNSVTSPNEGTDDAGGSDGTGVDGGYGPDDDASSTSGTGGGGADSGQAANNPKPGDAVDVSQLAKPRRGGSGKAVEDNKAGVELRPNVLHNYASWTYNIGLYMLDPNLHSQIVANGGVTQPASELRHLLIRSSGSGSRGVLGDKRDYYIENLRFISIFGQNSRTTKSSNNFDITFDIVEPYGVAFLAELLQYAKLKQVEDHFEIPYLLEIKFRGFDESGRPIPNIPDSGPKYIPIKIVNIQFKINSSATIYTVTAVPYAHSPLQNLSSAIIQESITIKGKTFAELMDDLFKYMNSTEESKASEQNRIPDTFSVEIHDADLANSQVGFEHITDGSVISIDRTTMDNNSSEYIQIAAGSTLKSAIQSIAEATDFGAKYNTTGQPESDDGNENKPFRLLKIMPVITKLGKYNTSTKTYTKEITFRIDTQKMYGFIMPDMPRAKPTERGWQKEYNWIFTGKNQDILDFTAEYNVQYFNFRSVFANLKGDVAGNPSSAANTLPDDGKNRVDSDATYSPAAKAKTMNSASQAKSFRGAAHLLAADHMDNLLNNPGADMLVIDLSIVGDPDWIPQDHSILPRGIDSSSNTLMVNGSIAIDSYDVFVMLKFKTPRDYNPERGLMQIDTEKTFVQGLYRVIQLESTFADGKFEQTLKLVRVQNQISNDNNGETDLISDSDSVDTTQPQSQSGGQVTTVDRRPTNPEDTPPPSDSDRILEEEIQRDIDAFGSEEAARQWRTRENSLQMPDWTRAQPYVGPR